MALRGFQEATPVVISAGERVVLEGKGFRRQDADRCNLDGCAPQGTMIWFLPTAGAGLFRDFRPSPQVRKSPFCFSFLLPSTGMAGYPAP